MWYLQRNFSSGVLKFDQNLVIYKGVFFFQGELRKIVDRVFSYRDFTAWWYVPVIQLHFRI